jgi:hypothetical protein
MGFGHWLSKVINKAKSITSDIGKTIAKGGKAMIKSASPIVSNLYKDTKSAISTVYSDAKSLANKPFEVIEHNVNSLSNLGSNLGSSFALPLAGAAAVVGIAYVMSENK